MSDFNLVPESYSYVLEQHKETIKESIFIKCSYEDLILNYEDIVENKDLYKQIKYINLHFEKNKENSKEVLKGSIEEKFYSEESIGNIRTNVFSGYGEELSSIDSHIFVQDKEFEYLKKCIHVKVTIARIYLTVKYGMKDDELLDGILFWSEKSYLSKEWKLSPVTNNILPVFGYEIRLKNEVEVEVKKDEYEIQEDKQNIESTNRNNLKEDINEVLHQNIIFQHHTKQFHEITGELEKLNTKLTKVVIVFIIFLLILKFV